MGEFVEHLKRKAESAGCEVIELNAYKLKMSQYDPQTDTYRKKPLKERWHRWGNTGTLVQRDAMSAFLACHVTENGHDRALLLEKWTTAEARRNGKEVCRAHFVRTVTFRRLCPLKELSDGQSESSVFRQGSFNAAWKLRPQA